jgi:hypothetical protein
MKTKVSKIVIIFLTILSSYQVKSQISDIKGLAGGAADALSGCSGSDVSAGCDAFNCFWNGGLYFVEFLIDHGKEIMDMRVQNPTLLSLDVDVNAAYSMHFSPDSGQYYRYLNYLPHIRGNLGIFSTDFRFNMLTEYDADIPDSYKSWELLFMLNFVPVYNFKISLGTGVFNELYTEKYYNEHYLNLQFGLFENKDVLDMDTRIAVDYSNSQVPFLEVGIRYKIRIMNMQHVYSYLSVGGLYQNYYGQHDIFGLSAGISFNMH